jgi:FkbM family methyltransferase
MGAGEFKPFSRLKDCRHGPMLYNVNDTYVGRSLDVYGEYSEGEADLFGQVLQTANVIVEVGANIGAHTVFLAQRIGPTGFIWAFEPQRIVFQNLCANIVLNNLTNVSCLPVAVGSQRGTIHVPILDATQENNFGALSLGAFDVGEMVPLITLDSLEVAACHFLKIDVEGMEKQVLQGATELVRRHRPILYIENDRQDQSDELIRYVDSLNYSMYWHFVALFNPNNFLRYPEDVFKGRTSYNMLCVHKDRPLELKGLQKVLVS